MIALTIKREAKLEHMMYLMKLGEERLGLDILLDGYIVWADGANVDKWAAIAEGLGAMVRLSTEVGEC